MSKILAIDLPACSSKEDERIAERYSDIIREFFGNKTFLLKRFRLAMYELPNDVAKYLAMRFNLYGESDPSYEYSSALTKKVERCLFRLDNDFPFLTESIIQKLQKMDQQTLNSDLKTPAIDAVEIASLPISPRIRNSLIRNRVYTISDLRKLTKKEILKFRNLGTKSLQEICNCLKNKYQIILY